MLTSSPNVYLVLLAALGWLLSLYFGFFRYRQFVWTRNKVRADVLYRVERQRSQLSSQLLVLTEIGKGGNRNRARLAGNLRRYVDLLRQMEFFRREGLADDATFAHWQAGVEADLRDYHARNPGLLRSLAAATDLPAFAHRLLADYSLTEQSP